LDMDGTVGLKTAPPELLDEARQRTRGYPRALGGCPKKNQQAL